MTHMVKQGVLAENLPEHLQAMARRIVTYKPAWSFSYVIPEHRAAFARAWVDIQGRVALGDLVTEPDMSDAFKLLGFASELYEFDLRVEKGE